MNEGTSSGDLTIDEVAETLNGGLVGRLDGPDCVAATPVSMEWVDGGTIG